jgi:hypothetical protein
MKFGLRARGKLGAGSHLTSRSTVGFIYGIVAYSYDACLLNGVKRNHGQRSKELHRTIRSG